MSDSKPEIDLDKLIGFPNLYTFKVVGMNKPGFARRMRNVVVAVVGEKTEIEIAPQWSKGAKYISLSISTIVMSKEQLLEVYAGFKKDEDVVMTL